MKQRYRLYDAETTATQPWRWFASPQAAQLWLDKKLRTKFWRTHSKIRHAKLVYPCAGNMSSALLDGDILVIEVIPESLAVPTLTHELAHGLVWIPGKDPERDHGKRFAGALIECYRHFDCAATADRLAAEFDERGVKWLPYD